MANPKQTWAQDAQSGAGEPASPINEESTVKTADTDRFGSPIKGDTTPIMAPQNKITDPVWGIQAPSGGKNRPAG
jgi:hypothetical protein